MLKSITSVSLLTLLLMTSTTSQGQTTRPTGTLTCPHPELSDIQSMIDNERFNEALNALLEVSAPPDTGVGWVRYLRGLAMFGLENYESGLDEFSMVVNHATQLHRNAEYQDTFRLAAKCLKKIGWYWRKQEEYGKAYEAHLGAYEFVERFGSWEEVHDAAVSLDVDSWFMEKPELSDDWIQKEIQAGKHIVDPHAKNRALGISYNNLAANLSDAKKFEEAERAAQTSLGHWSAWETEEGHRNEHRTVWSYFGLAEVYRQWGEHLQASKPKKAAEKIELARRSYQTALDLGKREDLSADDVKFIEGKIESTQSSE